MMPCNPGQLVENDYCQPAAATLVCCLSPAELLYSSSRFNCTVKKDMILYPTHHEEGSAMIVKSLLLCISFLFVSTVSAFDLKPAHYRLKMNNDFTTAGSFYVLAGTTAVIGEEPAPRLNSTITASIQSGISMGGFGTTVWSIGLVLQLVSVSMLSSSTTFDEANSAISVGGWGMILSILGPLPSCIGESMAISALNAGTGDYTRYYTRGWSSYGVSWIFTTMAILLNVAATGSGDGAGPLILVAGLTSIGGEIFRGRAAILPIINLNSIKARLASQTYNGIERSGSNGLALVFNY